MGRSQGRRGRTPPKGGKGGRPDDEGASSGGGASSGAEGRGVVNREPATEPLRPDAPAAEPLVVHPSWWSHPMLRVGAYAWALIGLVGLLVVVTMAAGTLRTVVVPLVLALFPAALLYPVARALRRLRVPAGLAALLTILGVLALLAGVGAALAPQVADEIPEMVDSVQQGIRELETLLDETAPFGVDAAELRDQLDQLVERIDTQAVLDVLRAGALGAAAAVAEISLMTLLLIVVLFFYLKDGDRLGRWVVGLFPSSAQADAEAVGLRAWNTVGAYFRGQLVVAVVDAVGIGLGLWLLGVPLALPLAVLVFFGGLFPIVGAVVAGALAVLVALASVGPLVALAVLAVVVGVQQLEGNVVGPLVLGRATELHPLAVITVITAGGILLGVLGAFLAVPVAASLTRGVGALRERRQARQHRAALPATGESG